MKREPIVQPRVPMAHERPIDQRCKDNLEKLAERNADLATKTKAAK